MSEILYIRTSVDIRLGDYYREFDIDYDATIQRLRDEGLTDEQIEQTSLEFSAETPGTVHDDGRTATVTQGIYRKGTGEITVYPPHTAQLHQLDGALKGMRASTSLMLEGDHTTDYRMVAREAEEVTLHAHAMRARQEVSDTLYHEMRHRRNDAVESPKGMRAFKAKLIGRPASAYFLTYYSLNMLGDQLEHVAHLDIPQQIGISALSLVAAFKAAELARYAPQTAYMMNLDEISAREAGQEAPADLVSLAYRSHDETTQRKQQRTELESVEPLDLPHLDILGSTKKPVPKKHWWQRGTTIHSDS